MVTKATKIGRRTKVRKSEKHLSLQKIVPGGIRTTGFQFFKQVFYLYAPCAGWLTEFEVIIKNHPFETKLKII